MARHFGIAFKLTLVLLALCALMLGGAGWLAYVRGKAASEAATIAELHASALEKQDSIRDWLEGNLADFGHLARAPRFAAGINAVSSTRDVQAAGAVLRRFAEDLRFTAEARKDYTGLFVMEPEHGRIIAATDPALRGRDNEQWPYFIEGRLRPSLTHLHEDPAEIRPEALVLSAPIRGDDGRLLGVLAGQLDMAELDKIVRRRAGLRRTDDAYVVEAATGFVTVPRLAGDADRAPGRWKSEASRRCLERRDGLTIAEDYRGVPVLAVHRWMPAYQMCLIVQLDQVEAYAPIQRFGRELASAGIPALAGAGVLATLLARRVSRPVRRMRRAAARIEHGEQGMRLPVTSSDELGQLAESFNRMAAALAERERQLRDYGTELERRVAEKTAQLAERAAELARSNQELERFAYVASHDLQEPLRMVASYTQLLGRRYKGRLDADADDFIAFAVDGASRMQDLINDLLTYSRVGTRAKPFEPTDCEAAVDRALANLRAAGEECGAVVTRDPLPAVSADASQLVQLFQNLIGNAFKFRTDAAPRVHIGARDDAAAWTFSVRDNGIGIDPRYHDQLFAMFKRLHTRKEYPGTGIGLAICKKIVERHGGRIWVESQPGRGSTFCFTLPKTRVP